MNGYIKRDAEKVIINLSEQFPVIMITGPRQVGKTTLLRHVSMLKNKSINYISLDNLDARELAIKDPDLFLDTYPFPLIIDEFQYAPKLLSYIKIRIDEARIDKLFKTNEAFDTMYYLTGSQSFKSMKDITETLAGRVGIIDLYGLSTREMEAIKESLFIPEIDLIKKRSPGNQLNVKNVFDLIFRGSFPEICNNKEIDLQTFYESYVRTYLERDIRDLINVSDEIKFKRFMVSIAARTGQELNLTEIANDAEISVPTANSWLSIVVNTGLVYLLEPFSNNIIKRVVKRPKLYFTDTGLASYLTKYPNAEVLEASAYAGHIFETYVISEIIKNFANNGVNPSRHLSYYRDDKKREIDLIIEYNDKLYPIEIKKGKNPNKDCIKNFDVLDNTNRKIGNGIVLCMKDEIFPIDRNNFYVPINYI